MTQFEQENDLGRGGGEVDAETLGEAWDEADARRAEAGPQPDVESDEADADEPWAKTSSGDDDTP